MDADRKSTVSSFYGGRKSSIDALNTEYPPQPVVKGRDDASSFFSPDRSSMDHLNGATRSSAGYNRGSFFHVGREEPLKGGRDEDKPQDDAWDVYADFNNAGPRYSSAFGMGQAPVGYSQIRPSGSLLKEEAVDPQGKVEMVTVPALGPEWGKDEMYQMTKAAKSERKNESRAQFWKSWNRGQRGLCGPYFTRKVLVFFLFGLCCVIAIVLAFTIPRVPSFSFNQTTPLVNATGPSAVHTIFSRSPTNFSFPALASLQIDTSSNFLPVQFTHLRATVFDLDSNLQVGSGNYAHRSLPAQSFPAVLLPLNFTYVTSNTSDQTWMNWYNACRNKQFSSGGIRPSLRFRLVLDMDIQGLPGHHAASSQVTDAGCPIELSANAA
ncbi:hypothetical protein BYT27DRAFT_7204841 [Phlegmacium glaucopus]|nr:hypothetical protein BYT27DRAFT_7204841 [Phlegmacium glaucopus]